MGKAKIPNSSNSEKSKCNKSPSPLGCGEEGEEMELKEMGGLQSMGSQESDRT